MSVAASLPILSAERASEPVSSGSLLEELLRAQQRTAVDRFSQWHAAAAEPLQARFYRDLIPAALPAAGEQYAFEVDLDACSGCKSCVAACHRLNGLEEGETWRSVGLLHGGDRDRAVLQHVTTACHHCLAPPCLEGCPVLAYEKDPITGIVRHLDDQCIGCQYCVLKCPYDVPQYSRAKGIVRKCDMCADRLAVGEAPACVQACPNGAIRIALVDRREIAENAEANLFLPGAPEPGLTLPTTVYKTRRPLPANLLPADYFSAAPQHAHWPLVFMLVLTQMSVGAFLVALWLRDLDLAAASDATTAGRAWHATTALILGIIGLAASVLHLGRPHLAYRAILGWRTSWLSREVLAFGGFALAAAAYAALPWVEAAGLRVSPVGERALGCLVAVCGLAGVGCSTMIYASTRRVFWNPAYTGLKFVLTALVLGIPLALLVRLARDSWSPADASSFDLHRVRALCAALAAAVAAKLLLEVAILAWRRARTLTPLRRTAALMTGDLARPTAWRFVCGALGGLVLPSLLAASHGARSAPASEAVVAAVVAILGLSFVGELLERYLFFAAVVAPKMPGVPAA